jgi:hypothetical protein
MWAYGAAGAAKDRQRRLSVPEKDVWLFPLKS